VEREAGEEAWKPCDTRLPTLSEGNVAKNHWLGTGIGTEIPYSRICVTMTAKL